MSEPIAEAVGRSALGFTGTVMAVEAEPEPAPGSAATAVVQVDAVLHAPPELRQLAGQNVRVQLDPAGAPLQAGDRAAFFVDPVSFGRELTAAEVTRLPVSAVESRLAAAAAGGAGPVADIEQQLASARLRSHAATAEVVLVGRVAGLANAGLGQFSEHDPDWWLATIEVAHVVRGADPGPTVEVLYANSKDVAWRNSPKPRASQEGLWLLHATEGELAAAARFVIPDPEDYQPTTRVDELREGG
ncbi:MAG TPA: hypothetical protein VJS67_09205 [Pseudonocardiaceae bacterium]|nr:hypothetical protein [Pseudonocardiaceae bacterium]